MTRRERTLVGAYPTTNSARETNMAIVRVTVDLEDALVEKLDKFIEILGNDTSVAALHAGRIKRSTVLRHVIAEGLAVLEKRYATDKHQDCSKPEKRKK